MSLIELELRLQAVRNLAATLFDSQQNIEEALDALATDEMQLMDLIYKMKHSKPVDNDSELRGSDWKLKNDA